MKLLVLAQTPPPLHGQSAMVQALIHGLPQRGIPVCHVNLRLSHDTADIGTWRPGKILGTFAGAWRAVRSRRASGSDTLYYVPAPPGKRGALYRDWIILLLCRPFFRRLVLHWHGAGLGTWLDRDATRLERSLSRALLGRADLAIVLAESLQADAARLEPRRVAIVPNGIADPGPAPAHVVAPACRLFFLGLGGVEKGLFAAAGAVLQANQRRAPASPPAFTLTAAGPFDGPASAARFHALCREHPAVFRHVGVLDAAGKRTAFAAADALIFPTRYAAEGFPLVALEALAHDRPVIGTRWRGLPDIITPDVGTLVPPDDPAALVAALDEFHQRAPAPGVCRTRYLRHFTLERHLDTLRDALIPLA